HEARGAARVTDGRSRRTSRRGAPRSGRALVLGANRSTPPRSGLERVDAERAPRHGEQTREAAWFADQGVHPTRERHADRADVLREQRVGRRLDPELAAAVGEPGLAYEALDLLSCPVLERVGAPQPPRLQALHIVRRVGAVGKRAVEDERTAG